MADPIWRPEVFTTFIYMKNWTRGFSGLLITQLLSDFENFQNSEWWIQYGSQKSLYFIHPLKNRTKGLPSSLITQLL